MAGRTTEERLKALIEREAEAKKRLDEKRRARKALEAKVRFSEQKQARKERTRLLIQMGGILNSVGFERLDQVDALKTYLLDLHNKYDWAPKVLQKIFMGELPEKFKEALPKSPHPKKPQEASNKPAEG